MKEGSFFLNRTWYKRSWIYAAHCEGMVVGAGQMELDPATRRSANGERKLHSRRSSSCTHRSASSSGQPGSTFAGLTHVQARAVRNLPGAAAESDGRAVLSISIGNESRLIEGRVRAGKARASFADKVSLRTRSKFLSCRISMSVEPFGDLQHHEPPSSDSWGGGMASGAASAGRLCHIGQTSIPVHELLEGPQSDWFRLEGFASSFDTQVAPMMHLIQCRDLLSLTSPSTTSRYTWR